MLIGILVFWILTLTICKYFTMPYWIPLTMVHLISLESTLIIPLRNILSLTIVSLQIQMQFLISSLILSSKKKLNWYMECIISRLLPSSRTSTLCVRSLVGPAPILSSVLLKLPHSTLEDVFQRRLSNIGAHVFPLSMSNDGMSLSLLILYSVTHPQLTVVFVQRNYSLVATRWLLMYMVSRRIVSL